MPRLIDLFSGSGRYGGAGESARGITVAQVCQTDNVAKPTEAPRCAQGHAPLRTGYSSLEGYLRPA